MKRHFMLFAALAVVITAVSASLGAPTASAAPIAGSPIAVPGTAAEVPTTFTINVVFVGYAPGDINLPTFQSMEPTTYEPLVRAPNVLYGITLPVHTPGDYHFEYAFAPDAFNDAFFGYLASIGTVGPTTLFQDQYNAQIHKTQTVGPDVLYIDGPSTERWLMDHARKDLGLDVANYTVFFVNWWGRSDFQWHVYTKTDSPDPDTGYNFGVLRASRKMIAWGGSFGRTWFYDLSAGPEAKTSNWDVDDADVDGDGVLDYRMPPVWEYGNLTGYRPFNNLSGDLAKVLRYVAVDLLFTTSPLYDPLATTPFPGMGKRVFVNMFEDDPGSQGTDWINKNYIQKTLRKLQPQYKWRVTVKDHALTADVRRAFRIWAELNSSGDCWNAFGTPFAELFCFFDAHRDEYLPPIQAAKNYVGGVFAFNTTDAKMGPNVGLLGYADDDWVSGTPSYVFEFDTPEDRALGYGFSTTTAHEFGHHIGMSHPHDGYDSTSDVDYDPTGDFYFAWSGDESHTIMSYIDLSLEFGWFDRDNMNRFLAGRYITRASEISAQVNQANAPDQSRSLLTEVNERVNAAVSAFRGRDYERAAGEAQAAFERAYRAAEIAHVQVPLVEPLPAGPTRQVPHYVDPIHGPKN